MTWARESKVESRETREIRITPSTPNPIFLSSLPPSQGSPIINQIRRWSSVVFTGRCCMLTLRHHLGMPALIDYLQQSNTRWCGEPEVHTPTFTFCILSEKAFCEPTSMDDIKATYLPSEHKYFCSGCHSASATTQRLLITHKHFSHTVVHSRHTP